MVHAPTVTQNCWSARLWNLAMVGCSKMARLSRMIRAMCSAPVNHQLLYVLYLVRTRVFVMMTFGLKSVTYENNNGLTCGAQ